nr:MAG TPA: hypothetical protein [Caudoviricetes sp.]
MTEKDPSVGAVPTEKKPAAKMTAGRKQENVVYIGPNSLADGLKRFTVYRGEPTALIEQASAKYKNIARLFVPVGSLNDAMAAVEKKGTPVHLAYNEVMGARK